MSKHFLAILGGSLLFILCAAAPSHAANWYVRSDGGTAIQCTGQTNATYPGSGTGQACAFSNPHYLWGNDSYGETPTWKIAGGDTVIISGGPYRMGYKGPNSSNYWGQCAGDPYGCYMPPIPSGSSSNPTKIYGENYATNGAKTQLYGGYGLDHVLNLAGSQWVTIDSIELTDHGQCARIGNSNQCSSSYPLDDYATNGISTSTTTANITLENISVHGFASRGWIGPVGGNITWTGGSVSFNAAAGIDLDDGSGNPSTGGTFTLTGLTLEWNGCIEEYPITSSVPAFKCFDQKSSGYGDAIGSRNNDLASFVIDRSTVQYNTQDGIDLVHSTSSSFTVTRSLIRGNMGQQLKLGVISNSTASNNLIVHNCQRLSESFTGAPSGYNSALSNFCRGAGDGIAINWGGSGTTFQFDNNTFIGYGATSLDIGCAVANCNAGTKTLRNNIFVGYVRTGYNSDQLPGSIYHFSTSTSDSMWTARSNNILYRLKNTTCPTSFSNETCNDPLLTSLPSSPLASESPLDSIDLTLQVSSPAKDAGVTISGLSVDYAGNARPSGSAFDIGAYEASSSPSGPPASPSNLTSTLSPGGSVTLNWTDNSSNETGFKIVSWQYGGAATKTVSGKPIIVGTDITTHTMPSPVKCGNQVFYTVYAFNDAGTSGYSNEVGVLIPCKSTNVALSSASATATAQNYTQDGVYAGQHFQPSYVNDGTRYIRMQGDHYWRDEHRLHLQ